MLMVVDITDTTANSQHLLNFNRSANNTADYINIVARSSTSGSQFPRSEARFSNGTAQVVTTSGDIFELSNRYVISYYFQSTTSLTLKSYLFSGGTLTEGPIFLNSTTTINGTLLDKFDNFWFGRSAFSSDPYLKANIVQINLYDGDVPTPTTTLLPLAANTISNTFTANTYSFVGTTGFYTVNVSQVTVGGGTYANSSTSVVLNGSSSTVGSYLVMTSFSDNYTTMVAPTNVQALSGGNTRAFVSWTASAGATSYTVTSSPGGSADSGFTATTTGTSVYMRGLANGTAYTFTVRATGPNGTSPASTASNSATPAASIIPTTAEAFIGRTVLMVVDITDTSANFHRFLDFNRSAGTTADYINIIARTASSTTPPSIPRSELRYLNGTAQLVSSASGDIFQLGNRYVLSYYFQSTTSVTLTSYLFSGGTLTESPVFLNSTTTINSALLARLNNFWFGRSAFSNDPYTKAKIVQITFYDGNVPTPTTTLLPLVNQTITNSFTANTYRFNALRGFYTVNTSITTAGGGTFTNSNTSVLLNGTSNSVGAYLTLTSFEDNYYETPNVFLQSLVATQQASIKSYAPIRAIGAGYMRRVALPPAATPPITPKLHIRAADVASVGPNGFVQSWRTVGGQVATASRAGTATLPVFRRNEPIPYVRFGTGTSSSVNGNFINFGSQTFNVLTNGGFTAVCFVRMYSPLVTWGRIYDFGNGAPDRNILLTHWSSFGTYGTSYRIGTADGVDNSHTAIPVGAWNVVANRFQIGQSALFNPVFSGPVRNVGAATPASLVNVTPIGTYVAKSWFNTDAYTNLDVCEMMWFDSALTDAQIATLMDDIHVSYRLTRIPLNGLIMYLDAGNSTSYGGTGTTWTDVSLIGGSTGTLVNAPTYTTTAGGEFTFNGTSQSATVSMNRTISSVTWIAWIKRNGTQVSGAGIFFNRGGVAPQYHGIHFFSSTINLGYSWYGAANTYTWDSGLAIPDQTWCMVAVSIQSTRADAYVNDRTASNVVSHQASVTITDLRIAFDTIGRYYNGQIGQAFMYDRALTAAEIGRVYNSTRGRYGV